MSVFPWSMSDFKPGDRLYVITDCIFQTFWSCYVLKYCLDAFRLHPGGLCLLGF